MVLVIQYYLNLPISYTRLSQTSSYTKLLVKVQDMTTAIWTNPASIEREHSQWNLTKHGTCKISRCLSSTMSILSLLQEEYNTKQKDMEIAMTASELEKLRII